MIKAAIDCRLYAGNTEIFQVPVNDRGLSYGDGVFETIPAPLGQAYRAEEHLRRLINGCQRLRIDIDVDFVADALTAFLAGRQEDGIVRLVVTRGAGGRGYAPVSGLLPHIFFSWHQKPALMWIDKSQGIELVAIETRLSAQPALAGLKHLCRLEQVLASEELERLDAVEGLMTDLDASVVEGTRSNVFVIERDKISTPLLDSCGVDGIFRQRVMQQHAVSERRISLQQITDADEVFVCNSIQGVVPVRGLGDSRWPSPGAVTQKIIDRVAAPVWQK